jgi:hypothetical protein
MRDAGCGMRDAGCGMRDAGCCEHNLASPFMCIGVAETYITCIGVAETFMCISLAETCISMNCRRSCTALKKLTREPCGLLV